MPTEAPIATITLRNYRCFGDSEATFELRQGFTAFVGPNNSGKSILLRLLRELRPMFAEMANPTTVGSWISGRGVSGGAMDIEDIKELVTRRNSGPAIVDVRLASFEATDIARVELQLHRETGLWSGKVFVGQHEHPLERPSDTGASPLNVRDANGTSVPLSVKGMQSFATIVSRATYIGAFRHAQPVGGMDYGDCVIGDAFVDRWHTWQTGSSVDDKELLQRVVDDAGELLSIKNLHVVAATGTKTLQVRMDGRDYDLREVGSGLAQVLIVLGNVAFRRPSFILIDEPELGLHPSLQVDFLATLASYSEFGVLFATHSLGLARAVANDHYAVFKDGTNSKCRPWQATVSATEFLGEMSYAAARDLGQDLVLCVEGPTDVMPIRQFLRALGKEHTTVVIHMGGDNVEHAGTAEIISELKRITGKVAVLLDSERSSPGGPAKPKREELARACAAIGVRVHLTAHRALENYFPERAVKQTFGYRFRALAECERLKDLDPRWAKNDNWRIARSMTPEEILGSDIGQFLKSL